jgi:hypothetical protein
MILECIRIPSDPPSPSRYIIEYTWSNKYALTMSSLCVKSLALSSFSVTSCRAV